MKEDFVGYNLAVKLKEKGFRDRVRGHYKSKYHLSICSEPINCNGSASGDISAPQIHEVLKWLRKEKKLFVEPSLFKAGYEPFVQSTVFEDDKDYTDTWRIKGFYPTYEQAVLTGIEYVIDNLI